MSKISLSYPDTWLTISISVKNRDTWVEEFTWTMTEVSTTRVYIYDFTELVDTDYTYVATVAGYSDMSGVVYRDGGGLTTEESIHLLKLENFSGWFSINYQAINSHTTKKVEELKEQIEKIPNPVKKLDEIVSQNDIAKTEILDRIEEAEMDLRKDIKDVKKDLKEESVSTRNLVRQKTKKLDENTQKLADRQEMTDKMIEDEANEIEASLEKIYEQEAEMIEKDLEELYKREADEIEKSLTT